MLYGLCYILNTRYQLLDVQCSLVDALRFIYVMYLITKCLILKEIQEKKLEIKKKKKKEYKNERSEKKFKERMKQKKKKEKKEKKL